MTVDNRPSNIRVFRVKTRENTDSRTRIGNFNEAVLFGPIFICSCCSRKLYENGVTKITPKFRKACDEKTPKFYSECIEKDILVTITFNGKEDRTGHYICHTCRTSMRRGKMPSMAVQNGLQFKEIDECCNLTELENNLIAQNINFQYIFCLPNSRWAATKKAMISVPVTPEIVLNTISQLPRMPKDAGLIPVNLKRKLTYQGYHKKELIDPNKIFKTLDHLKESGHPDYQFYQNQIDFEKRNRTRTAMN